MSILERIRYIFWNRDIITTNYFSFFVFMHFKVYLRHIRYILRIILYICTQVKFGALIFRALCRHATCPAHSMPLVSCHWVPSRERELMYFACDGLSAAAELS